jgi:hypothetical protein
MQVNLPIAQTARVPDDRWHLRVTTHGLDSVLAPFSNYLHCYTLNDELRLSDSNPDEVGKYRYAAQN